MKKQFTPFLLSASILRQQLSGRWFAGIGPLQCQKLCGDSEVAASHGRRVFPIASAFVLCIMTLASGRSAIAADISYDSPSAMGLMIGLRGEIRPGDDATFARLVGTNSRRIFLNIDSPGGDVHAALRIGRILRQHDGAIQIGKLIGHENGSTEASVLSY